MEMRAIWRRRVVAEKRTVKGSRSIMLGRVLPTVVALLVGVFVWQGLVWGRVFDDYDLPAPAHVWTTWWYLWNNGSLWHHVSATLSEALLGFLAAFVVGGVSGYLLARSPVLSSIFAPYIAASQAMPMIALAPLLVVWFGLGLSAKVIICALIVFFPILVNTVVGLRTIDRDLLDAARNLGANWWQTIYYVEVPLALRTLLGGIRMGLTLAMTGAIVGEFVAADAGLGFLMNMSRSYYDSATLFAAALTMSGLTIIGYLAIGVLEFMVIDWD